ncbi:MAG TPA: ABC transporter ATP-binding protein [Candidatus Deferrimicrobium sp.]|nr:ABC transporter ATP-binding protein [Candidatus Deferrimicrobium sp.]
MVKIMVHLRRISKVYDLGEVKVHALRNVDLFIKEQEFTAIMGPSGSGKTTLLNMIGALDLPTTGRVIVDGIDITDFSEGEISDTRCKKIGFIFQFFNLVPLLTAIENIELPMLFSGELTTTEAKTRAKDLLTLVGLGDRLYHRPAELSGGQQQRVAIARSFANNPAIILADEPSGNLDRITGIEILQLMKRLNREEGQTFIMVTHDPAVAGIAERVIYVIDGRIAKDRPRGVASPDDTLVAEMAINKEHELARLRFLKKQIEILKRDLLIFNQRRDEIDPILFRTIKEQYTSMIENLRKKTRWLVK